MSFPDLLGFSTSGIRGSLVRVSGGVTSTGSSSASTSAPICDGFTLFQTSTLQVQHCLREGSEQLP